MGSTRSKYERSASIICPNPDFLNNEHKRCLENTRKYLNDIFCIDTKNISYIKQIKIIRYDNCCEMKINYFISEEEKCTCEYY